ncbi:MAG TPA: alkaline phosphatase family protein [Bryobacteraceae bacterium]|nr:alkaline phosphatase family protein [Bryobacteraceae bacterium]
MLRHCKYSLRIAVLAATLAAPISAVADTATPIKYLVVIFDENNSFDHYFATYPNAANPPGEPAFIPLPNTPSVNGLTPALITNNPNSTRPFRIDRGQENLCDNDNHYADEQNAYHAGLLDKFPESTDGSGCPTGANMGYYDGNTVTALWNYAQHFAMSDNFFDTEFGTTVMGHLNLVSGQTHQTGVASISGKVANGSVIANINAGFDDCSGSGTIQMTSKNVGDLLNASGITWGWFYDSFARIGSNPDGTAVCNTVYNNHYDPFMYYASTSNPHHLPPSSVDLIGQSDQANHQYDLTNFWDAAVYGNLPAVSFLKFQSAATGHPSDSTALAEQRYLVQTINALQRLPQWNNMAIMITYDDSDGWYDHVMPPIVSQSNDSGNDTLMGSTGMCGTPAPGAYLDRCGYGTRLPFLVISPFAKQNFVDSTLTDLTSILRFIEDNWNLGRLGDQSFDAIAGSILNMFNFTGQSAPKLFLAPDTGLVTTAQ